MPNNDDLGFVPDAGGHEDLGFVADAHAATGNGPRSLWEDVKGVGADLASGGLLALDKTAEYGRKGVEVNKRMAELMAKYGGPAGAGAGEVLKGASKVLLPQDRLGAALAPLSFMGGEAAAARNFLPVEVANAAENAAAPAAAQLARAAAAKSGQLTQEAKAAASGLRAARGAARVGAGDPGSVYQAEQGAEKAIGAARAAQTESQMAADAAAKVKPVLKGGVEVVKPGPGTQTAGSMVSASTGAAPRHASAVLADTSILGKETPSMAQVSKEYQAGLEKAGMSVNEPDWLKEITGSRFPPTETESGKLKGIVDKAMTKLADNTLEENEAFLARKAAATLARSGKQEWITPARAAMDQFDQLLESSTLPNIRDLSRRYFRAAAKEAFQSWLPLNKNMSPNALRTMIMAHLAATAAGAAAGGLPGAAVAAGLKMAAMSPKIVGGAIRGAAGIAGAAKVLTGPAARAAALPAANAIKMLAPDGSETAVPPDRVDDLVQQGYSVRGFGAPR